MTTLFENPRMLNVFDKVNRINKLINENLPEIKEDRLIYMMGHLRQFYEGKLYYGRRTADPEEKKKRKVKKLNKSTIEG